MNRFTTIIFFSFNFFPLLVWANSKTYRFTSGWTSSLPITNSINDILVRQDSIWFGTESGLSLTINGGTSWMNFANTGTFDSKGISAIAKKNNLIWVATGYSTTLNGESVQTGGGLHYSTDRGSTWTFLFLSQ